MNAKPFESSRGLLLTRRKGETILVGADVEITVVEIRRGDVGIRIRAPAATLILRAELRGTEPRPATANDHILPESEP